MEELKLGICGWGNVATGLFNALEKNAEYMPPEFTVEAGEDLIVVNHLSRKNAKHYLDQIKILTQRLALVRASQSLSGVSFILNLLSIYCSYIEKYEIALNFFGFGVLVFALAILTFIYEIQLSTRALSKHLEDLKDLS